MTQYNLAHYIVSLPTKGQSVLQNSSIMMKGGSDGSENADSNQGTVYTTPTIPLHPLKHQGNPDMANSKIFRTLSTPSCIRVLCMTLSATKKFIEKITHQIRISKSIFVGLSSWRKRLSDVRSFWHKNLMTGRVFERPLSDYRTLCWVELSPSLFHQKWLLIFSWVSPTASLPRGVTSIGSTE